MGYYGHEPLGNAGLPQLRTFGDALNHYYNTKPIRGRSPEVRPLGTNRRYHECSIDLGMRDNNRTVECKFWGETLVVYYLNDEIEIRVGRWVGPSVVAFIDKLLPKQYGGVYLDSGRIIYYNTECSVTKPKPKNTPHKHNTESKDTLRKYHIPRNSSITLQLKRNNTTHNWRVPYAAEVLHGGEPEYTYYADRKALKEIRNQPALAGFITYTKALNQMQHYKKDEFVLMMREIVFGTTEQPSAATLTEYIYGKKKFKDDRTGGMFKVEDDPDLINNEEFGLLSAAFRRLVSVNPADIEQTVPPYKTNLYKPDMKQQTLENHQRLLSLINSNDPSKWLTAHKILAFSGERIYWWHDPNVTGEKLRRAVTGNLDRVIKTIHADKVFNKEVNTGPQTNRNYKYAALKQQTPSQNP